MRYGEHTVLSDVYLKCSVGDIVGIFGRNGSGKTTIIADHDYRSVAGIVNRFCMLDGGALKEIGLLEELRGVYFL